MHSVLASRNLEAIWGCDRNAISDAMREVVSGQASAHGVDVLRAEAQLIQVRKEAQPTRTQQPQGNSSWGFVAHVPWFRGQVDGRMAMANLRLTVTAGVRR